MSQRMDELYQGYRATKRQHAAGKFYFGVGATLVICSTILLTNDYQQPAYGLGLAGLLCWLLSWRSHHRK